eukprot:TRINITY_DN5649_c1_g1_i1.p2 TRINITY_DN5649_c1_g1~~TRINITY_DN5649_c1_g1_i1.p2  ORF type:complete len:177 (+),score=42.73 TRINITY_DN5649_c1_g1_i1:409-939(+)
MFVPPNTQPREVVPGTVRAVTAGVYNHSRLYAAHCRRIPGFAQRCARMSLEELLSEYDGWHNAASPTADEAESPQLPVGDDPERAGLGVGAWRESVPRFPLLLAPAAAAAPESPDPSLDRHHRLRGQFCAVTGRVKTLPQSAPGAPHHPGARRAPGDRNRRRQVHARSNTLTWVWV